MSGDWIKIRVWLARDPKVIRMADHLAGERAFMCWACDPVHAGCHHHVYEHLTRDIVVSVVVRGLVQVWGVAREDGHRDSEDDEALILPKTCLDTLDEIAGYPGFGEALAAVGWAEYNEDQDQVTLPKFFLRNHDTEELRKNRDKVRKRKARGGNVRGQSADSPRNKQGGRPRTVRGKSPPRGEERRVEERHSSSAEECKEELPQKEVCSEPAEASRSEPPPVLVFPTVGKGPKEWNLNDAKVAEYQESFPGVDVLTECKKARQWCVDNPTKRKTARGMPAFLTRWLGKVQDSGRGGAAPNSRKSREDSRQEVLDQWLRTRQNTSPGANTTPTDSGSATPTPGS